MEEITLTRSERIAIFVREYYLGLSPLMSLMRMIGGPVIFYMGYGMYTTAPDRFGIGYGGLAIGFSVYYTTKPLWWVLIHWKNFRTIEFQLETTPDRLLLKEGESESQTEYGKFKNIYKRSSYFALQLEVGSKIYIPFNGLSTNAFEVLSEKARN